jgi:hypothetical protein
MTMAKRCKIGDRAFIIRSRFQENLGKIVRVVGPGMSIDWVVESEGSPLVIVGIVVNRAGEFIGYTKPSTDMRSEAYDSALLPIRGESEKEAERKKAMA